MQLIIAAILGVCAAARLEHLERGYLPPDHSHGETPSGFTSSRSSFGGSGSNSFRSGSSGFSGNSFNGNSLSAAQLKQYLPPDHEPSAGNFGGSFQRNAGSQSKT